MIEISIIIATFNAAKTIKSCIESILSQKNYNVELIIIDGLSSDDTIEIINSYKSEIDYLLSECDSGVYHAWNKGISIAKGNWIMFIGADDVLLPNSISEILQFIALNKKRDIDYISAKNIYIDVKDNFIKIIGEEFLWSKMKTVMCVAHVGSLHNRNLFNEVGLYSMKYKICADYDLLLRKKNQLRALFINTEIAKMKIGGMSFSLNALIEVFKIRRAHSTLPFVFNLLYFLKDFFLFYTFIPRKNLYNYFYNVRKE